MIVFSIGEVSNAEASRCLKSACVPPGTEVVQVDINHCLNDPNVFSGQIGGLFASMKPELRSSGGALLIVPLHLGKALAAVGAFVREIGYVPDTMTPYQREVVRGS